MSIDKETIVKEIQRLAKEKDLEKLTREEFSKETGISSWQIYQVFDGGWRAAMELAGLRPNYQNIPISDDTLFQEMQRVFISCKGVCSTMRFNNLSKHSLKTYTKRFGNWHNVLYSFRQWLENSRIDFPFIEQLSSDSISKSDIHTKAEEQPIQKFKQWDSIGGNTYGPFLNFRGLQHAPLNEQGVVFLFGMVCFELGFVVEAIRTGYPDCDAKRCIDKKRDKWERVRIEFEFKSSNFKEHGHKPELCDLIVCWEHDWQECPVDVLELKSELKNLNE